MILLNLWKKKTGIKINFETGSRDDWETKLNLAFSTGDYPDADHVCKPQPGKIRRKGKASFCSWTI